MFKWLSQYFTFSTGERRAIVVIVVATLVIVTGLYAYKYWLLSQNHPPKYTAELETFAKQYNAQSNQPETDTTNITITTTTTNTPLHNFNPNTIGKDEWINLGLSEKQALSIEKYIAKGGKFYKPEDLKKLYVLSEEDVIRLMPYVKITGEVIKPSELVEINSADSAAFEALPGIGPVLTHKILAYRAKLGGFIAVEQLKEIQSLPIETYESIKPQLKVNAQRVSKLNINTSAESELKLHPYLRVPLAKAIIKHRDKNGNFKSLDDLKNIAAVNDSIYKKVMPYLKIE